MDEPTDSREKLAPARRLTPTEGICATPVASDEERAFALYARGLRREEIAATLGVSSSDLRALLRQAMHRVNDDARADRPLRGPLAIECVRAIYAAAWAGFERDREIERAILNGELDHIKRRVTRAPRATETRPEDAGGDLLLEEFERPRVTSQGPRYLTVALAAQRELARLLGLYDEAGKDREPVEILITRNPPWPEPDPSDDEPEGEPEGEPEIGRS